MTDITRKLDNTFLLSHHPRLRNHLPETTALSINSLRYMLQRHQYLYVKPDNSCQGKGILRIDAHEDGRYQLTSRDHNRSYKASSLQNLWKRIQRIKRKNRPYIIQQGIESRTKTGRLFDIRVHLTRIHNQWEIGGFIGRVATEKGIATNAYSGGIPVSIPRLFHHHLNYPHWKQKQLIDQLSYLSHIATHIISSHYPKWNEFGLDIGIDERGHPWIYEINIYPGLYVFRNEKELLHKLRYMRKIAA
ncbi:YheC/D like ATP-grasp [Seinonella peptonophila]|uniref:YheC/D like ATP-grasp n=1 Tax=Seinonella peptonophila TaxID=112248 RepID=A0A1M4VKK6_9BACL|nr:YheC/YheD family protein [Seinonella peptonophila]SHE69551.1 YheC/D like ATP-grasp [Seinonella peptonophila]